MKCRLFNISFKPTLTIHEIRMVQTVNSTSLSESSFLRTLPVDDVNRDYISICCNIGNTLKLDLYLYPNKKSLNTIGQDALSLTASHFTIYLWWRRRSHNTCVERLDTSVPPEETPVPQDSVVICLGCSKDIPFIDGRSVRYHGCLRHYVTITQ